MAAFTAEIGGDTRAGLSEPAPGWQDLLQQSREDDKSSRVRLEQVLEALQRWAYQRDEKQESLEARFRVMEALFASQISVRTGRAEDLAPLEYTQIECGYVVLPLRAPCANLGALLREQFDIPVDAKESPGDMCRAAVRRFLALEHKAAIGAMSEDEMATWKKICVVVDREEVHHRRKARTPLKRFGEVCVDDEGKRTIKWSSGSIYPLSLQALSAIEFLDVGEWFEADVYENADGSVLELRNLHPRPDYRLGTDEEVADFFSGNLEK